MENSSETVHSIYKSRNNLIDILESRNFNVSEYNEFSINGKCFRELEEKEKKDFLNKELMFCIYDNLPNEEKGRIFRTMNETTDVNFIEMVNSYGDIPIANLIREITRLVPQIENSYHR